MTRITILLSQRLLKRLFFSHEKQSPVTYLRRLTVSRWRGLTRYLYYIKRGIYVNAVGIRWDTRGTQYPFCALGVQEHNLENWIIKLITNQGYLLQHPVLIMLIRARSKGQACPALTGCCPNGFWVLLKRISNWQTFLTYWFYWLVNSIIKTLRIKLGFEQQPLELIY